MISTKQENEVTTKGMSESINFKIKASGKAFSILTSNLYSRKIHAILRELGCNAIDAHVSAGNPEEQFEVHLPSSLTPEFKIRDYGTGISEEDIGKVYTVLFESTKDNTNDSIGCLGLGSKTPFSYTSSFIVQSFQKGIVKTYSMYLSPEGCPCYSKVGEKDTIERDGLLVKFAVNPNDINKFIVAAGDIYKWFKIKPIFANGTVVNMELGYDIFHSGDNYKIINGNNSYAIMGNIAYPLGQYHNELFNLKNECANSRLIYNFLNTHAIIIEMPIGLFDIAPSREEMSLDNVSISNITNYLYECVNDYKKKWAVGLEFISNMDSYFMACYEFSNYNDKILTLFSDLSKDIIHNKSGKELNVSISYTNDVTKEMGIKCYEINNRGNSKYTVGENFNGVLNPRYFFGQTIFHKFYYKTSESKSVVKRVRNYLLNSCHPNYSTYSKYKVYVIDQSHVSSFANEFGIPMDLFHPIEELELDVSNANRYSNYNPKVGTVTKDSVRGDVLVMKNGKLVNLLEDSILEKDMDNVYYTTKGFEVRMRIGSINFKDNPVKIYDLLNIDIDEKLYIIHLKTETSLSKVKKWENSWEDINEIIQNADIEWGNIFEYNYTLRSFKDILVKRMGILPEFLIKIIGKDIVKEKLSLIDSLLMDEKGMPKIFEFNIGNYVRDANKISEISLVQKYNRLNSVFSEVESNFLLSKYVDNFVKEENLVKQLSNILESSVKYTLDNFYAYSAHARSMIKNIDFNLLEDMESSNTMVGEENEEENEEDVLTECV